MAEYRVLINKRTEQCIAGKARIATGFLERAWGLLGKKSLPQGEALLIRPCNFIHMFFMRFAIDLVFCSRDNRVIKVVRRIKPWRLSPLVHLANYVIELPAGAAEHADIQVDDQILEILE